MLPTVRLPFIAGEGDATPQPLARYLPPLPAGAVRAWLSQNVPAGSWILDPLGSQPALALEAARAGYRVLTASNNPILTFSLEVQAAAPDREAFVSVLAALASSHRGEDRLEHWAQRIYTSVCAVCGAEVQVTSFIWQKDQKQPVAKLYRCAVCGDEGERPFTNADAERTPPLGSDALHRSRALARVVTDPAQTAQVEAALVTYTSRPLIVLNTLINKAEGLNLPPERMRLLTALLISACDEANTLWPHPSARPRPKQLTIPPQYRENNLWLALENAIFTWSSAARPVTVTRWPQPPPAYGGICLFPGRVRSLFPLPETIQPAAVINAVPRPNQAFWTLCALWSGWLWGREAVAPLRGSLDRRHYDWYWMTQALHQAYVEINAHAQAQTPLWLTASELIPGFCLSVFDGPLTAGFHLENCAYEPDQDQIQLEWRSTGSSALRSNTSFSAADVETALEEVLAARGEPCAYLLLMTAVCSQLATAGRLPGQLAAVSSDLLTKLQAAIERALRKSGKFTHYSDSPTSVESGLWGLSQPANEPEALADRVERFLVSEMIGSAEKNRNQLYQAACSQFPGLLTPDARLAQAVLDSYGCAAEGTLSNWTLNPKDAPAARRADLQDIRALLADLADHLGLTAEGELPVIWHSPQGEPMYAFFPIASAIVSRFITQPAQADSTRRFLVIPGSRAELLSQKMDQNPQLQAALQSGWRVIKFRHIRRLAERVPLDLTLFTELLDADPLEWSQATQMRML